MDINVIHNEKEYQLALRAIEPYFDAEEEVEPGTPEGDRFTILAMMIEAYENRHYPISLPDPIAAIKFRMEQGNMKVADLVPFIGAPNRVYEVLNKKRALSIDMIRGLVKLGIPAEILVQAYEVERKSTIGNLETMAAKKKAAAKPRAGKLAAKAKATTSGFRAKKPASSSQPIATKHSGARKAVPA